MKSYQSLLIFLFFLVSCNLNSLDEMDTFSLELDPRLSENEKGL